MTEQNASSNDNQDTRPQRPKSAFVLQNSEDSTLAIAEPSSSIREETITPKSADRTSPEKERQALLTLDQVIQSAEDSMGEICLSFVHCNVDAGVQLRQC